MIRRSMLRSSVALLLLVPSFAGAQQNDPERSFSAQRDAAEAQDTARLAALVDDREALQEALDAARERQAAENERRDELETRQAEQRKRLDELAARRDELGSDDQKGVDVQAVADVLDRHVGELRDELANSWLTLGELALPARGSTETLLTPQRLETVADALMELTRESGGITRLTVPIASVEGQVTDQKVVRLGDMAAFSNGHWLRQGEDDMPPAIVEHTPTAAQETLQAFANGEDKGLMLDPTRGKVLDALAQHPSLLERFHQGGAVGYVVVALGALGLLVALVQYGYLLIVTTRLRRQLKNLDRLHHNNPLGRILHKFGAVRQGLAPEALEARLDEALLAEQPRIERGQALVKLLAAIAPLLGLLGTVTGMIVTFQAITVFGTGDPQLMAGGISQALVTTVLGLITAVPLLFAHTALASRSRQIVMVLEGQASAVLAEHLEAQPTSVDNRHGVEHASPLA
ncbi:MotA/TolQ/ExbB proton channel family protein [Halomonas sp. M20]|uniref:MotA/TolQ/ExbB proton channel family protein n=1 Tax=Halomonas sp. M20 TaxID=2763264 RepID=UPI001D0AA348|nr:MotA/TolQ/ExbB proton channel family protein [Halomonas sp. M20]